MLLLLLLVVVAAAAVVAAAVVVVLLLPLSLANFRGSFGLLMALVCSIVSISVHYISL